MVTCALITVILSIEAIACDVPNDSVMINEYDIYQSLQQLDFSALIDLGYTEDLARRIIDTEFSDLIYERATLSDEALYSMGYSSEKIEILRAYNGSYADTYALAGVLTADIKCQSASNSTYQISYDSEWDHVPFVYYIDAIGLRWVAIAQDGLPVDVYAYSSKASINYYYAGDLMTTISYVASDSNFASETDFNALSCSFSLTDSSQSLDPSYALSGSLSTAINRVPGVSRSIYYLKVCGCYGHSILSLGAPTLDCTVGDTSVGITFSGGIDIDNIGIKKYIIYTDKTMQPIDA